MMPTQWPQPETEHATRVLTHISARQQVDSAESVMNKEAKEQKEIKAFTILNNKNHRLFYGTAPT